MQRINELEELFGKIASSLPTSDSDDSFIITENSLPCPQKPISTAKLVVNKGIHDYGSSQRLDQLCFFAHKETYRQLALMILACVFSKEVAKVELLLTHEKSDIKKIVVESEKLDINELTAGYYAKPFAFAYQPEIPNSLHPLYGLQIADWGLPQLLLTNEEDLCLTEEDWKNRSVVCGFGTPIGATHFANLIINVGLPATKRNEFYLESYPGNKSVAPWSSEARICLPGVYSWDNSLFECE